MWWKHYFQFHSPSGLGGDFQLRRLKLPRSNDEGETWSLAKGFDLPAYFKLSVNL
jgi:hypothetical protein